MSLYVGRQLQVALHILCAPSTRSQHMVIQDDSEGKRADLFSNHANAHILTPTQIDIIE